MARDAGAAETARRRLCPLRGLREKVVVRHRGRAGRGAPAIAERRLPKATRVAVTARGPGVVRSKPPSSGGAAAFRLDIPDAGDVNARIEDIAATLWPSTPSPTTPGGTGWRRFFFFFFPGTERTLGSYIDINRGPIRINHQSVACPPTV